MRIFYGRDTATAFDRTECDGVDLSNTLGTLVFMPYCGAAPARYQTPSPSDLLNRPNDLLVQPNDLLVLFREVGMLEFACKVVLLFGPACGLFSSQFPQVPF
jgi:hypothetical protein